MAYSHFRVDNNDLGTVNIFFRHNFFSLPKYAKEKEIRYIKHTCLLHGNQVMYLANTEIVIEERVYR